MARKSNAETKKDVKPTKKMTQKEIVEWDALYQYVRKNVLKYDDNMALPKFMTLRLKGMTEGKFITNNATKEMANYSYELILLTFKFCNIEIQRALREVRFKDEQHKFNYIMRIVDANINDVYMRLKKKEEVKKEVRESTVELPSNTGVAYKPKKKTNDRFDKYW